MSEAGDLERIRKFLGDHHILALSAARAGELWAWNCFYVFDPDRLAFYMLTEFKTRHGQWMAEDPAVAGTVSHPTETVTSIQGVQLRGRAYHLEGEAEKRARSAYLRRFPIARMRPAPIWELVVDEFKMTDNTLGFGKKTLWSRAGGEGGRPG